MNGNEQSENLKCMGCGIHKDTSLKEMYPYPDDGLIADLIDPLLPLDCQGVEDMTDFRHVSVCHECFHKLSPDMWISENCWKSLNPIIPFNELPKLYYTGN